MSIKDLHPREPIGAVVSIGKKDSSRGFPTQTDRWHIVQPKEDNGVRPPHPAFNGFNNAAPEARKVIRGNIVHSTRDECMEYNLKAQILDKSHPDKRPACIGNGVTAVRWVGPGPDEFMDIKCLNERCEYRQAASNRPPKCKPFARLLFRLSWKEGSQLPSPLVKFTTGSWNTTANLVGFFDYIDTVANQLGLTEYSLFGFPFVLTLTRQTKASTKSAFPVVTFSPEMDPVEFFMKQRANIAQLQNQNLISLPELQGDDEVFSDVQSISVPSTQGKDNE